MTSPKEAARYLAEVVGIPTNGSQTDGIRLGVDHNEQQSEALTLLPFPTTAFNGLFQEYRSLVAPTTEAPDVYHYFAFALTFGATLGRRRFVYHAGPLFPNFFLALVGRTGTARKDTARSRANRLLNELNLDDSEEPIFTNLPGVGSAEGLIETFSGEGKVVVVQEAELLALMAKARRDATANLMPHLTALYDSPAHHTLKTRANPVNARRVFLSIFCGTTPTWLRRALTETEAYGGFANRFIFAFGAPKPPMAFPPKVDESGWTTLKAHLNDIRAWGGALGEDRELDVSTEAVALFEDWYANYYELASGEGLLPALAVRFQSFAWKLALLYAAQEEAPILMDWHLKPALDVVDWLWQSNSAAFSDFVQHGRELELAIMDRLKEANGEPIAKRTLYKSLHVSARELEQAVDPLLRLGLLQPYNLGVAANGKAQEGLKALEGL